MVVMYGKGRAGSGRYTTVLWISALIVIMTLAAPALADVGPNSLRYEKYIIERCYLIQNAGDYPGYVFGVAPWPGPDGGFVPFDEQQCFRVNNYTHRSQVYAMRATDYQRLKTGDPGAIPCSSGIPSGYPAPLQAFGITFSHAADNRTDTLTIVSLTDSGLVLNTTRSAYMFRNSYVEDDTQKTEPTFPVLSLSIMTVPPSAAPPATPLSLWGCVIAVIITLCMVFITWRDEKS